MSGKVFIGKRESYLLCVKCAAENYFLKADISICKHNDRSQRATRILREPKNPEGKKNAILTDVAEEPGDISACLKEFEIQGTNRERSRSLVPRQPSE